MTKKPNTFFIRTYGCQMNELDTEVMAGLLSERGMTQVQEESEADLLIFNTCSIRDLAERKAMGKIGLLTRNPRPDRIIGVTGCMANAKKEGIFRKLPHVDFILGTNNIHDLNAVLDEVLYSGEKQVRTDEEFSQELDYTIAKRENKHKAYVSIIRGCDKFCTYCVVPYTRGPEVSRSPDSILEECKKLINEGCKEIILLGQNVNSYGKDKSAGSCLFHDLLYQIDKISHEMRVRFLTSHPVDISYELMEAIRDLPTLCEHVHFPLQAGSNRILKKMHRIYTREEYMAKVQLLKETVPHVALGTDMIVGFPTETEEEFLESMQALSEVRYANAFLYTYSPRKGTPAMRWMDDISEEIKLERHHRIFALQNEISSQLMTEMVGSQIEILVEKRNKDGKYMKGVSRCWRNVIFEGDDSLSGTFQKVNIHSFSHNTLLGTLVKD